MTKPTLYVPVHKWEGEPDFTGPWRPASPSEIAAALDATKMEMCSVHMAPRVWTGEDNCIYRASWKPSYPGPCEWYWVRLVPDAALGLEADE